MKIAICDDDKQAAARLSGFVTKWVAEQQMPIEVIVTNGSEPFLAAMEQNDFDLALLDIRLEDAMTGIDLARIIRKRDSFMSIVFVTNHEQYAIQGIKVNASDYLSKPVDEMECRNALDIALEEYRRRIKDVLTCRNLTTTVTVPKIDILYCQSKGHYIHLYKQKHVHEFRMTIKELLEQLPWPQFVQCSKNAVVNLYHVECYYNDHLVMSNGDTVDVSRRRAKAVNEAYIARHMSTKEPGTVYSLEMDDTKEAH